MADDKPKDRKRMIVEEVSSTGDDPKESQENIVESETTDAKPAEEIKEKVEELQEITEHMGEDVEKSADVQEELAKAAEKVVEKPSSPDIKSYAPVGEKSKGPNALIIIIPGVLLLGAILGGIYFYQKSLSATTEGQLTSFENNITPDPSATVVPSASPSAKLDLTKYPITVQNGSGIPGTAASAKDLLVKAGFKVEATGNADNYGYKETVVKAKADVPKEFLAKLEDSLSGVYKVTDTEKLPDSSKNSVIVIIGSSKAE